LATRHFLETQPGFKVCGEAVDGIDALEKASHLNPDLIILDVAMPRRNGLQTACELRARMYKTLSFCLPAMPTLFNLRMQREPGSVS
jgi:DNA-binding NarL/FixJ family response regulator